MGSCGKITGVCAPTSRAMWEPDMTFKRYLLTEQTNIRGERSHVGNLFCELSINLDVVSVVVRHMQASSNINLPSRHVISIANAGL